MTTSLLDILSDRAKYQSEQQAYIFLQNGETESGSLTYGELDRQARAIAAEIQSWQGERALLMYPSGLEFITAFFGCLYAGVIAVPVYPPRRNQNLSRLLSIVNNAQAKIVLTSTSILADLDRRWDEQADLAQLKLIPTDSLASDSPSFVPKLVTSETLAFLQYTSGSTGTPKGVMVTHGNIIHNQQLIQQAFSHSEETIFVGWLPLFHDMGLIGNVMQPMYLGIPCILMPPVAFLQQPIRWLQAISKYRATTSGGPNFAYDLCVKKIRSAELADLDLSSWDVAFSGAEPVRAETLTQFSQKFANCGFNYNAFYPCYGMAETTLLATGGDKTQPPVIHSVLADELEHNSIVEAELSSSQNRMFVGCGRSYLNSTVMIVNPDLLTSCQTGQVGEIWVSGESIAAGYWDRPETTKETFQAYLHDTGAGPFLRTGDLGFLQDGELFITGRLKDVIILRGRNHYPQDIELTVEKSHPALRSNCNAAFEVDVAGEKRLVIAQEVERTYLRKLDIDGVTKAIRRVVSECHELQLYGVVLLKTGSIPKTSSGKIQRSACRAKFLENSFDKVGEWKLEVQTEQQPVLNSHIHKISLHNSIYGSSNIPQTVISPSSLSNLKVISKIRADNMIEWLRSYASERINSQLIDERRCIPPYIVLDFGNRGLLGMQVPEKYGGMALSYRDTFRVFEQLAAIDLTLASFVAVHHVLGTRPIIKYASQSVRNEMLPLLAQGRELAGFAITEPSAGSNPRGIVTQAIPDSSGGWRLSGQKSWIGHGSWAGVINVFAQMLDANNQSIGISGFVVRQGTQGLCQGTEALTMGMRGMVQNSIYFNDVLVGPENLLSTASRGMEVAQDAMMQGRLLIGVVSLGSMKRCAQLMLRYSSRRSISTGRLLDNPISLVWLSDLTAAITSLETLIFKIGELLDEERDIPEEAFTVCKTAGSEFIGQAADRLVQLLGGRGYIETNIAPKILRDARLLRIFEGPTETLNMFLGSRIMNQSTDLQRFLCEDLGSPEVAQSLMVAVNQIRERSANSQISFLENQSVLRWTYICAGEVVTLGIILAAVQGEFARSQSASLQRAVTWTKLQFEQKLANILSGIPGEMVLCDAQSLTAHISDYVTTIGDVEQTLAGEDHSLDKLLQRQTQLATVQSEFQSSEEVSGQQENGHNQSFKLSSFTAKNIENWLENWLTNKLRIAADFVSSDTSFADYGIDSVMAVELTQDLEEWLKYSVEPTIIWNFPTIKSLAQHFARTIKTVEPQVPAKTGEKISTEADEPWGISVEASIAQELVKIETLLGKKEND
jgi:acyl-CoA synthetase (AMP-forming)/AMP-acid ligase II/alkylation response protein AidB-like acyl-CoA dehydrogenase/acyl carrier protein